MFYFFYPVMSTHNIQYINADSHSAQSTIKSRPKGEAQTVLEESQPLIEDVLPENSEHRLSTNESFPIESTFADLIEEL